MLFGGPTASEVAAWVVRQDESAAREAQRVIDREVRVGIAIEDARRVAREARRIAAAMALESTVTRAHLSQ